MDYRAYQELILQHLPSDGSKMLVADLELEVARAIEQPIDPDLFSQALETEALAEERTGKVRLIEPDLAERDLMPFLNDYLRSQDCLSELDTSQHQSIIEDTSVGGPTGSGMFSRPDFSMAIIRTFRFDPIRYLDLHTFELKNRSGATLQGVHEALAHRRFAHRSYYVFPRSRLRPYQTQRLIRACMQYGLGAITFAIGRSDSVGRFKVEHFAERGEPNPYEVDQFIEDRFNNTSQEALKKIVIG